MGYKTKQLWKMTVVWMKIKLGNLKGLEHKQRILCGLELIVEEDEGKGNKFM